MFLLFLGTFTEEQQELLVKIFKEYDTFFRRISFGILGSASSAEDAVSMSYIKIMENIEKVSKLSRPLLLSFCITIVKNTAIDITRKSKKFCQTESMDSFADNTSASAETICINKANIEKLASLPGNLSEKERQLIHLKYVHKMKYSEIGELLDISEETAKKTRSTNTLKAPKII